MPKFSIVIPHYGARCHDLLAPCLNSIIQFSDLNLIEVLVVANGCTDNTKEFVESLGEPFRCIWFDEAIGYTKACNEGMKQAKGEYIILLNNDTELQGQPKNDWLNKLEAPFLRDEKMAITGPMKAWCPYSERYFLIGFCTCFRKSILDKIGLYDEIFEAYGEDMEICGRAEDMGYKFAQVPDEEIRRMSDQPSFGVGDFYIWHKGNESYRNWPGGNELLRKNREILRQKFNPDGIDISNAKEVDGYMDDKELVALGKEARKKWVKVAIEIGSWKGRSSRAIADNLSSDAILYCVDTWQGSKTERETNHQSAAWMDGDFAYYEFCKNLFDHIQNGKVIPLRMTSLNAAKFFKEKGIKADFIFLDGGHTYEEVVEDIIAWKPLLKKEYMFAGHDFNQPLWPGVTLAALDLFGTENIANPPKTNIWLTTAEISQKAWSIYDCFIFNNELEILAERFETLYNVVDRFVIVEATATHQRKPKPLHFQNNLDKFGKYLSKVTHIICDFPPELNALAGNEQEAGEAYWTVERYQRNKIMDGLTSCKENDTIIISDCDEIPNPEVIKNYKSGDGIKALEMDLYYYNSHCKAQGTWCEAKVAPFCTVRALSPCGLRYSQADKIPNAGRHLSYFGGVQAIINKIETTAHREYNNDYFKNPERVRRCIENCEDLYERPNEKFQKV